MSANNGGPAFPTPRYFKGIGPDGMTLRDYFAAKAMAGFCSAFADDTFPDSDTQSHYDVVAYHSYRIADAMIAARERGAA